MVDVSRPIIVPVWNTRGHPFIAAQRVARGISLFWEVSPVYKERIVVSKESRSRYRCPIYLPFRLESYPVRWTGD